MRFRKSRLKRATVPGLAIAIAFLLPVRELRAEPASFEGTVSLTRSGTDTTQYLFTRKGNQLRIENADRTTPEPINVVDLAANKLTIIYPHNSTFVQVDLGTPEAQMGAPNLPPSLGSGVPGPPGFPPPPNINPSSGEAATGSGRAGPAIPPPPGFPAPPPMPSRPPMPNNPMASGPPMPPPSGYGAPGMPPMPQIGGFGGTPALKKTDKTKKIQGFDCTLYTISDRMETFEIWATADSALFPFRLIQKNSLDRRFGPRMLEEQWVELLQKQSLFPLQATLRMDLHPHPATPAANGGKGIAPDGVGQGPERFSFKVNKIEKTTIDNDALFKPPENYQEIQAPQF